MRRFARRFAGTASIALLLASGCGESDAPTGRTASSNSSGSRRTTAAAPALPRTASDAERARLGLIREQDVPDTVIARDQTRNHASCSPRRLFKGMATAIETSPRFRTEDAQLQESVLLFRTAAGAARAFRALDKPATHRCIAHDVRESASTRLERPITDVTELTITVEPVGQQSSTYRVLLPIPQHNASVDVLVSRIGRALSSSSLVWSETPRDLEFQEALVEHIAARVSGALR